MVDIVRKQHGPRISSCVYIFIVFHQHVTHVNLIFLHVSLYPGCTIITCVDYLIVQVKLPTPAHE